MKNVIKIKVGTENLTEKMQDILANLNPNNDNIIEFEKGTYYFYRKGSLKHKVFSSGGPSTENYVVFPIFNVKNLTIDGNGSDFVFCDRMQTFMVQNSENITFKNFQTDFSFMRYAYGKVSSINDEGFAIELDKNKFDYYVKNGNLHFVCGEDTLSTKTRKISMKRIAPSKSGVYFLYSIDTEAIINKAAPSVFVNVEEREDGVFFRYGKDAAKVCFEVDDVICLAYDNDREAQTFYSENSKNITVENVCIHRGGGMGFVADTCENITLDGFKICLKEGRKEYFTTTADGVFLTNCSGDFVFKNCLVRDTYDDAMNVHGFYTAVKTVVSETEAELEFLHPSHYGLIPCKAGDTLRVSDPKTFMELGEIQLKEVFIDEERKTIRVIHDGKTPLDKGQLLENAGRMPTVLIENSSFINCPHIRLSAGKMIVRNNSFALNDGDLYIWDLIDFWSESGATQSVEITGNRFADKAHHNIEIGSCRPLTSNRLHERIVIQNNDFEHEKERALFISAVNELVEDNNKFGCK